MKATIRTQISRYRQSGGRKALPLVVMSVVALVGVATLVFTQAATPSVTVDPELGVITGPAKSIVIPSAQGGGAAVEFGSTSTTPVPSGLSAWNDPATWGGSVPVAGADVVIPAGKKVLLNVDAPQLNTLTVNGELHFADRPTTLRSKAIIVYGAMYVGTETAPLNSNVTIVLEGETAPVVRTIATIDVGSNVMVAANGGKIEMHGKDSGIMKTKLAQTANAGATSITLMDAVSWQPGDKIVLSSTVTDWKKFDEATVASRSADGKTITLTGPLTYQHSSTVTSFTSGSETRSVEERGDVGLLTKNIKVTGASNASTTKFSSHTIVLANSIMKVNNVEFAYMGQENVLGKYPIHYHLVGDASGSYAKNTSIHHSFNRFFTVHRTNNLNIDGGVWHDSIGHGFMFEDGVEVNNRLNNILAMTIHIPPAGKRLRISDAVASEFWVTHPTNDLTNIIAAGGAGSGVWYDFNFNSDNLNVGPVNSARLGKLDNIEAHSHTFPPQELSTHANGTGIMIDDYYGNLNGGRQFANNWNAWMNAGFGIWQDGAFTVKNVKGANNDVAWNGQHTAADGGILLGNSNNPGSTAADPCGLVRFYHGQADIQNVWLGNYEVKRTNDCVAKAAIVDGGASSTDFTNRVKNIKFFGNGYKVLHDNPSYWGPFNDSAHGSHWFEDVDGSIKGDGVPAYVTNRRKFITIPSETIMYPNAGRDYFGGVNFGAISPKSARMGFGSLVIDEVATFSMTRLDTNVTASTTYYPGIMLGVRYRLNDFPGTIDLKYRGNDPGWFELELPNSNSPSRATFGGTNMRKASSEADLATGTQSSYYYDTGSRKLVVRIVTGTNVLPFGNSGDDSTVPLYRRSINISR